jgi:hypothetical protein
MASLRKMGVHGPRAQEQPRGDFARGRPDGDQPGDGQLLHGELIAGGGRAVTGPIGAVLATVYAGRCPVAGVVNVDQPDLVRTATDPRPDLLLGYGDEVLELSAGQIAEQRVRDLGPSARKAARTHSSPETNRRRPIGNG